MPDTPRVLLVDDSPYDRKMVCRELSRELGDVDFVEVTNAAEFDVVMETPDFDLVVTDYQIRWTDGLQVLNRIRTSDPNCPVLMFTATGSEEIAVAAMKAGLDDYILKKADSIRRLGTAARAALEHAEIRRRATQMEQRFFSLLEQLNVGVFRRTPDGVITEANQAAATILDVPPEQISGFNLNRFLSRFTSIRSPASEERELQGQTPGGQPVWLTVSEYPVTDSDGILWFDGLIENITARKQAQIEIDELQEEAAHTDRINIIAEMGAGIAHQLAQPLQIMSSFAGVTQDHLQKGKPITNDVLQWLQNIENLAEQAGNVIRGLNEFNEHRPRNPAPTDVCELIRSTMEMLSAYLRHRDIRIAVEMEDGVQLEADAVQLRQVVMNLVKASVQSLSERDEGRALSIRASQIASGVRITLSHNGARIPAQQVKSLFAPWVSRRENHPGIGLSISARIIEAHRGRISAINSDDGVTFSIELPVRATAAASDAE